MPAGTNLCAIPRAVAVGGTREGAPAASCSMETAFGLGSLSSKLVDPHLRSSQNWFRKKRLQMNFINLNCDDSLTRAFSCTSRGLSYVSHEGSNIGLTRPASPCAARCGVSQPPAAAARAIPPSSLSSCVGKAAAPLTRLRSRAAGHCCVPAMLRGCFPAGEAAYAPSPPWCRVGLTAPGGRCRLRVASVCPSLRVLGGPGCHPRAGAHPQSSPVPLCARVVPNRFSSIRRGIVSHAWETPGCTVPAR